VAIITKLIRAGIVTIALLTSAVWYLRLKSFY